MARAFLIMLVNLLYYKNKLVSTLKKITFFFFHSVGMPKVVDDRAPDNYLFLEFTLRLPTNRQHRIATSTVLSSFTNLLSKPRSSLQLDLSNSSDDVLCTIGVVG